MKGYKTVTYKGADYCVCRYIKKNGSEHLFVIDAEDLEKILATGLSWYCVNGYIGYAEMINLKTYHHYLHNLVMNKQSGGGKGQKYTIDHITRNKHDNRKVNLRLVSQSSQNENQGNRTRTCELPENCEITLEDIPKCVYYCKPQSGHGEMFIIELKKDGQRKMWKSTSSKSTSLKDKLIEIKKKLLDISKDYPELIESKNVIENYSDEQINLMKEFNKIIMLSKYKCATDNLMKIPEKKILTVDIDEASPDTKKFLLTADTSIKTGKRHKNNLPDNCGITPSMIPKYCYYQVQTDKRGDAFVIDRHPKLPNGKRQWKTSGSKAVSTIDKFKQLKSKLNEIEKPYTGSKSSKKIIIV